MRDNEKISTRYGLEGPRIESRCGVRFYAPIQTGLGYHLTPCTMRIRQNGRVVALTTHPRLTSRLKKEYSYAYTPHSGPTWCVPG